MEDTIGGEKFNELTMGASAADLSQPGVGMREGARLVGRAPVQIGKGVPRFPRLIEPSWMRFDNGDSNRWSFNASVCRSVWPSPISSISP